MLNLDKGKKHINLRNISEELHKKVKMEAARQQKTMFQLVIEWIEYGLSVCDLEKKYGKRNKEGGLRVNWKNGKVS
jgi:hypothetical protein